MPYVLHAPLYEEGCWLDIYHIKKEDDKPNLVHPVRVYIPFCQFLIVRGDVVHSGSYGSKGNIRLHIVFKKIALQTKKLFFVNNSIFPGFPTEQDCKKNVFIFVKRTQII